MPELNCPHCHFQLRVPDSLMGKRLRCKNESCKRTFVAELQPAGYSSGSEAPPPFSDMPADWQQAAEERQRAGTDEPDYSRDSEPASSATIKRSNKKPKPTGNERYPNLLRYLGWTRLAILVLTIIAYFAVVCLLVAGGISLLISGASWLEFIGGCVILLVCGAFWGAMIYLYYVFSMAGIELIQVVIDIEENTRKQPALEGRS